VGREFFVGFSLLIEELGFWLQTMPDHTFSASLTLTPSVHSCWPFRLTV
jgi:hypothetical protein